MAPSWWKHPDNKLKGCQEFLTEACDIVPHDGCCSATPCSLCLEWETYTGIDYGSADFGASTWSGTVGGIDFTSYWERNSYDECEYVVTFGGYEVYRATCYEGASCRNPAGEVSATVGTETGTLRWSVYEPRELELIDNPETGCRDFFCGSCRCSCDCFCVTITSVGIVVGTGQICDVSYPCDAPVWEGTVGDYDLSFALGRDDETGECIITATVNGEEQQPVFVTGCADMSASVTLYDGTVISVVCRQCSCNEPVVYPCECRRDGDSWEADITAGATTCTISSPPLSYASPLIVPEAKRAWNDGDCVFGAPFTYLITAFPPLCIDPNTSHFIAFVQKVTSGDTPFIDNSLVQENEWYAVVYDDTTYDIIGISYEYSSCCKNETPTNAATSHLIWVQWDRVPMGGGIEYSIRMTNLNAVAAYGTC
jgi:hypothetical protein